MEKVLSLIEERTYLHKTQDEDKQNKAIQQIKLNSYMDPVINGVNSGTLSYRTPVLLIVKHCKRLVADEGKNKSR